jgi:hypothetical protein
VSTSFDALAIRRRLGKNAWAAPVPYGEDGWAFLYRDRPGFASIIISAGEWPCTDGHGQPSDDGEWWHASMNRKDRLPDYRDMVLLHKAVWPHGFAYQVFASPEKHINFSPNVLHLWGKPDGRNVLPDFGMYGTI